MKPFFFFLFLETSFASTPSPVDRIVIVIEEYTITQSDIALERELAFIIPSSSKTLQHYRETKPKEALLQRNLLRIFAGDIGLYSANPTEIQYRYEQFLSHWKQIQEYNDFTLSHGLDEARLLGLIKSQIIAENYLKKNIGINPDQNLQNTQQKFELWLEQSKQSLSIREVPRQEGL
jgi:hypothetical protein